jgi:hypothetical protein
MQGHDGYPDGGLDHHDEVWLLDLATVPRPSQQSHKFRLTMGVRFLEHVRKVGAGLLGR